MSGGEASLISNGKPSVSPHCDNEISTLSNELPLLDSLPSEEPGHHLEDPPVVQIQVGVVT